MSAFDHLLVFVGAAAGAAAVNSRKLAALAARVRSLEAWASLRGFILGKAERDGA